MPKIPFPSETGPRLSSVGYMEKYTSPLEVDPAPKVESGPETGISSGAFNVPDMLRGFGTMVSDLDLREKIASIDWKEKIKTAGVGVGAGFAARAGLAAVFGPSYLIGIAGGAAGGIARSLYVERKKIIQDSIQYKIADITAQLDQNESEPVALAAVMVKARQLITDGKNFVEDKAAVAALEEKLTVVQQKLEAPEAAVDKKQQLEYILSQLKGKQKVRVDKLQAGDAKKILESVVFEHETREIVDKKYRYLKAAGKGALIGALGFMAAEKVIELGKDIFFADAGAVIPDVKPAAKVAVEVVADTTRQTKEQVLAELHKSSPSVRVSQGGSVYGAIREMAHNRLVVEGKFTDGLSSAANHIPEKYLPAFQEYVADAVTKRHKEAITIIREGKTIIWDGSPSSILPADRIQVPDTLLSEAITQAKQKLATPQLERLTEAYVSQVKPEVVAGLKADQFIGSSPKIGDEALSAWWMGKQEALQAALQKIKEVTPPEAVPQSEDLVSPETWETLKWASKASIIPVTLAAAAYGVHVFRKKGTVPEVKDASAPDEEVDAQKQAEIDPDPEVLETGEEIADKLLPDVKVFLEEQGEAVFTSIRLCASLSKQLEGYTFDQKKQFVNELAKRGLIEQVGDSLLQGWKKKVFPAAVQPVEAPEAKVEKVENALRIVWNGVDVVGAIGVDQQKVRMILKNLEDGDNELMDGPDHDGLNRITFQKEKPTSDQLTSPQVVTGKEVVVSLDELLANNTTPEDQWAKIEGLLERAYNHRVIAAIPELQQLKEKGYSFILYGKTGNKIIQPSSPARKKFVKMAQQFFAENPTVATGTEKPVVFKFKAGKIIVTRLGERNKPLKEVAFDKIIL